MDAKVGRSVQNEVLIADIPYPLSQIAYPFQHHLHRLAWVKIIQADILVPCHRASSLRAVPCFTISFLYMGLIFGIVNVSQMVNWSSLRSRWSKVKQGHCVSTTLMEQVKSFIYLFFLLTIYINYILIDVKPYSKKLRLQNMSKMVMARMSI